MRKKLINRVTYDDVINFDIKDVFNIYKEYSNQELPNVYKKFSFGRALIEKAEGSLLTDYNGKKVFDLTGGLGVANFGHNHPRILSIRRKYAESLRPEIHKSYLNPFLAGASNNISAILKCDLKYSFFCNSGAESVDGALKITYKRYSGKKNFVLHSDRSFHGKTLGAGSISAGDNFVGGKGRFYFQKIPNVLSYEFNNFKSIVKQCESVGVNNVYAIFIEPYSCSTLTESSEDFLRQVREYGAGEGQISIMLARMGVDVTVIDIDDRYLESIRAQADSLGVSITLKQGKFGDGYKDQKFDRILFFEAFHHAFDHKYVVNALKPHLAKDGFVVFSGEPIVERSTTEALFVPFPWGPRLDGISIRSTNKFGWCELGFQQEYFVEMLMRAGFLVTYLPCPVTGRGNCYIAKPNQGKINCGEPYLLSVFDRDSGWCPSEGSHRWTKESAYLTLPDVYARNGGDVTLKLKNFLPVDRDVTIGAGADQKTTRVIAGAECVVTVSLQPMRYLEIHTPYVIPKEIIPGCLDARELGIAVIWIELARVN
jgi:hypothetical protein